MIRFASLVLPLILFHFIGSPPVSGQEEQPSEKVSVVSTTEERLEALTPQIINERREQDLATADLEDAEKADIGELYSTALDELQRCVEMGARTQEFRDAIGTLEKRTAAIDRRLKTIDSREPKPPSVTTLKKLEQLTNERERIAQTFKEVLQKIESETSSRTNRRQTIRSRIAEVEDQISKLQTTLKAAAPTGEAIVLTRAKRTEMIARHRFLTAELPALKAELELYDAEESVGLLGKKFDLTSKELAIATSDFELAEEATRLERERQAQKAIQAAQAVEVALINAHPALKELAAENKRLAERRSSITTKLEHAETLKGRSSKELDNLRRRFESTQQKVASVTGLPESVGAMLRKQRLELPDVRQNRQRLADRQVTIDETNLAIFDLDEQRVLLSDVEQRAKQFVNDNVQVVDTAMQEQLIEQAKRLFTSQKEIIEPLSRIQNKYFNALTEQSVTERQLISVASDFSHYIDQRVLWIRSSPSISKGLNLSRENLFPLGAAAWTGAIRDAVEDAKLHPLLYLGMAIFIVVLTIAEVPLQHRLNAIGEQSRKGSYLHIVPTIRAIIATVFISLVMPATALFISWRLARAATLPTTLGLSEGFFEFGCGILPFLFFRQLCRKNGVAECHFLWQPNSVSLLSRYVGMLMVLPVLSFMAGTILAAGEPAVRNPVPRLLLMLGAGLWAVAYLKLFNPDRGIIHHYVSRNPDGWIDRLRYVWYWGFACIPLSVIALACLGYEYTARQIAIQLYFSIVVITLAVVAYALFNRIVLVQRRRLSIAQARERRAKARATAEAAAESGLESTGSNIIPTEDDEADPILDLHSQTLQTRRFGATVFLAATVFSLWLIWSPILPALDFLEQWPLWTTTQQVAETFTDETGEHIRTRDVPDPVTIFELGLAVLIGLATFTIAANVPGLLEISLLQRLPLQRSVRYAITTLSRYVITLVGLLIAFKTIGLRWSQIQWMATALTFGLAFGLQEMFANFVAGIIILFERPIRVGDIVTVDDVTGTVSRIRMRATTITNWDRKDYIVPNKDFITDRVLNWTLSDKFNRIVVTIGIAYGSDVGLAKQLLSKVADDHPIVVDDPFPITSFESFDDSSLRFVLRCYISMADMPMRLQVVDDLHTRIDAEFRKANIEIAFPQTDLHIRDVPEALHRPTNSKAA